MKEDLVSSNRVIVWGMGSDYQKCKDTLRNLDDNHTIEIVAYIDTGIGKDKMMIDGKAVF